MGTINSIKRNPSPQDLVTQQKDSDKEKIKRLRSFNEVYAAYKPEWDFFLDAYEGGRQFAQNPDNLARHFREVQKDFDDRVLRCHYLNYCESLVDFFTDFIFADAIDRNGGKDADFYNTWKLNVNRKGEDIDAFMRQVCDEDQIFGMTFVLVDAPRITGKLSKQQELEQGVVPYFVQIRPDEILDWIVDPFDNLLYLKRVQVLESLGAGNTKVTTEIYTEWTQDEITISPVDISQGVEKPILGTPEVLTNPIGMIPIVVFRYARDKRDKWMGKSFLKDLAYNNREVMQLTSLLQEFLYRQCFNMLAMAGDDDEEAQADQEQGNFGQSNVILYPKDSLHLPAYVSPPTAPAKILQDERQRIVQEMYKRSHQDMVNELSNGTKSSGFSKNMSFASTVPKIAARADTLEKGEIRLMQLVQKYRNTEWDGKIKYKDRYELTNITDALSHLGMLFKDLQLNSETFVRTELKRMVNEFDGKIPVELRAKIESEIDAIDIDEFFATQKLALIGRAATSPFAAEALDPLADPTAPTAGTGANPKEASAMSSKTGKPNKPTTSAEAKAESSKSGGTAKK